MEVHPEWYVNHIVAFARRYVAERSQEWQDHDSVKAQGWAILLAAEDLRSNLPVVPHRSGGGQSPAPTKEMNNNGY